MVRNDVPPLVEWLRSSEGRCGQSGQTVVRPTVAYQGQRRPTVPLGIYIHLKDQLSSLPLPSFNSPPLPLRLAILVRSDFVSASAIIEHILS